MSTTIRTWRPDDNDFLLDIARQMGVPARIRLGVDRSPDFTEADRVLSSEWELVVADVDGRISGFTDIHLQRWRAGDAVVLAAYAALAGATEGGRRRTAFHRMVAAAESLARARGARLGVMLVNAANPRLLDVLTRRFPGARAGDPLVVNCLLAGRFPGTGSKYACGPAGAQLGEVLRLAGETGRECEFAMLPDARRMMTMPGLTPGDVLVARDDRGQVVASLGIWNQAAFRRIRMLGVNRGTALLRTVLSCTRRLTGSGRLPKPGENLTLGHMVFVGQAAGCAGAMSVLVRHALRMAAARGTNFLLAGLPASSRLTAGFRGLFRLRNVNIPLLVPLDDEMSMMVNTGPTPRVWLEYALA